MDKLYTPSSIEPQPAGPWEASPYSSSGGGWVWVVFRRGDSPMFSALTRRDALVAALYLNLLEEVGQKPVPTPGDPFADGVNYG